MNFKALIKSLLLRKFATSLLLLQLTLTLALLVNSTMIALDTYGKINQPKGLKDESLLVVQYTPTSSAFDDSNFYRSIIDQDLAKIKMLPGVINAAPANQSPMQYGGWNGNMHPADNPEKEKLNSELRYVADFYGDANLIETLGVKLLEGRFLNESDRIDENTQQPSLVITESLAKALFDDQSALGQLTNRGMVVGVLKDFKIRIDKPMNIQYAAFYNRIITRGNLTMRYFIQVDKAQMKQVQSQLNELLINNHAERDIRNIYSFSTHTERMLNQDIGLVKLFSVLCLLMIFVTAISCFAHAQFHITKQTKLIGIRRALGASKRDILLYVFSENWLLNGLGLLLGLIMVFAVNVLLSNAITVSQPDMLVYLLCCILIVVISTFATWVPAWQTSRIAPVVATRTI